MRQTVRGLTAALGIAAVSLVSACARETVPRVTVVDHDIQGSWGQDFGGLLPGFEFIMALNESSGTVSGTGTYAGEAGPYGALAVSGTVARFTIHLRVIYNADPRFSGLHPDTAQFDGVLSAADTISGTLAQHGAQPSAVTFVRLRIGDPAA